MRRKKRGFRQDNRMYRIRGFENRTCGTYCWKISGINMDCRHLVRVLKADMVLCEGMGDVKYAEDYTS